MLGRIKVQSLLKRRKKKQLSNQSGKQTIQGAEVLAVNAGQEAEI